MSRAAVAAVVEERERRTRLAAGRRRSRALPRRRNGARQLLDAVTTAPDQSLDERWVIGFVLGLCGLQI
jgi:hypothetical protein